MAEKCKIKMSDKVEPVAGSIIGTDGKETGTCPTCETPGVMLSIVGGFIRAHVVADAPVPENNPQAATKVDGPSKKVGTGLSEPQVTLTDTGVRVGDPRAAEQRRTVEIESAAGTGTVQVPRKVDSGKKLKSGAPRMTTKLVDVPATKGNVREALEYWKGRKPKSDGSRAKQNDMVSSLIRRYEAIVKADGAPVAEQKKFSASVDTAQAHRGPTLVRGRDAGTRVRPEGEAFDHVTDVKRGGAPRMRTTLDQPLGRERFDRKITDVPEPAPVLSVSQKRRARRNRCRTAHAQQNSKG